MRIVLPGQDPIELAHLISDLNGTLGIAGRVDEPVLTRLRDLASLLSVHLVTSDTFGTAAHLEQVLGGAIQVRRVTTGAEKVAYARQLGAARVVAIGNGRNDVPLFTCARLRIAVCSGEGLSPLLLPHTDVLVTRAEDALDLLLHPQRLMATLKE